MPPATNMNTPGWERRRWHRQNKDKRHIYTPTWHGTQTHTHREKQLVVCATRALVRLYRLPRSQSKTVVKPCKFGIFSHWHENTTRSRSRESYNTHGDKKNQPQQKGKGEKGIGQKKATVPYHCSFCPISFRLLCLARGGPYLPYSQRWVWLVHCSESHTPGISPRFYLGLPWSHFHGNCRGWGDEGRRVRSYFQGPEGIVE